MDKYERIRHSRQQQLETVHGYIDRVLLPVLDYSGTVTVKPAEHGSLSHVYFLEGPNLEPLVLRCEENKSSLKRRIRGHEILLRHGFHVPRIVHQNLDASVQQKFGFYFMVETSILGQHFNDAHDTGTAGARLGEVLARMHEFTSWRHGWPGEWRWPGSIIAGLRFRRKTRNQLEAYRERNRRSPEIIADWLRQQPVRAWFPRPRLTTGGFISSNLLVDRDRVIFIDLARVRYAFAARDIAQIRFVLTRYDQTARDAFFESYRQHASKTLWAELERTLPLFEGIFLLRLALKEKNVNRYAERDQELLRYCRT